MNFVQIFMVCGMYLSVSIPIFLKVYDTSKNVIDEDFHIKQAKSFCEGNFNEWDPKITTFPGLYLVSYILLPYQFCTTFYLRCISLSASVLNIILIYKIALYKQYGSFVTILNTINISIVPPLYFFAHLYYTDVISVSAILGLYYYWLKSCHKSAALCDSLYNILGLLDLAYFIAIYSLHNLTHNTLPLLIAINKTSANFFKEGFAGIMIRQTNVVWVSMFLGISIINELLKVIKHKEKYYVKNKGGKIKTNFQSIIVLANFPDLLELIKTILLLFWSYILIICGFIIFVIVNGSIVVGDKTAHIATLHIPQVFYFSIFAVFFGFFILLQQRTFPDYKYLWQHKILTTLTLVLIIVIIHYNTIEHPYLVADNRHYTFYVWSRFYAKYKYFKYAMAPIYLACISLVVSNLKHQTFSFQLMYYVSTIIVLFLQSLIEVRYFIIPYIILRLNLKSNQIQLLLIEFLHYMLINALTFYIFFYKEIWWENFEDVQKLIW